MKAPHQRRASLLHDAAGISPLDNAILMMIRAHVGKPCPTRREIMEWTGVSRRQSWVALDEVAARGLIEIELRGDENPKRRRMRVAGESWTDWTARTAEAGLTPRRPRYNGEGNVINIDQATLKNCVDEIEASRERQKAETRLQQDIFKKVRGAQLDPKAVRIVLQRRAMGNERRDEQDYYVHAYEMALGGKKAAMEALASGASQREAAEVSGLSTGAVANLAKASAQ